MATVRKPREEKVYELIAEVSSRKRPDDVYEIRRGSDGTVYCTCPSWRFSPKPKTCWHLDEYLVKFAGREPLTTRLAQAAGKLQNSIAVSTEDLVALLKEAVRAVVDGAGSGPQVNSANDIITDRGRRRIILED